MFLDLQIETLLVVCWGCHEDRQCLQAKSEHDPKTFRGAGSKEHLIDGYKIDTAIYTYVNRWKVPQRRWRSLVTLDRATLRSFYAGRGSSGSVAFPHKTTNDKETCMHMYVCMYVCMYVM